MVNVDQKKILVLGGTKHIIDVVVNAKQMGMSPIVVDNVVGSPAKGFADKAFNTSTSDIEGLMKIIQNEKVDGIYTAFEDIGVWSAVALCKKMDLPFYMTGEQMEITSYRDNFKEICRRFGVLVIEKKELAMEVKKAVVATWEFPIMVEPIAEYTLQRLPFDKVLKK